MTAPTLTPTLIPTPTPTLLRVAQLLKLYPAVPRATLYSWLADRLIPHYRVGRVVLVSLEDVRAFLADQRVGTRP